MGEMNNRSRLTNISTNTDANIQAFYDQYPYPPPIEDLDKYTRERDDENNKRADFHLHWPGKSYTEKIKVLVAGCGTSQAARYAIRHPLSEVVGIDFSGTSVRHTQALKTRHQLANLEVHQLPIQKVSQLKQRFDKIICTGVLHHLPDPEAGLLALREVLADDGVLNLMLYAPYGRFGIYLIQEYCRNLGIKHTDKEIVDLAQTLTALPPRHPLAQLLAEAPDFRRKDALADALLNPQDRAYKVPDLFDLLERCGLSFGRWLHQAPYMPTCSAIAQTPHAQRFLQLPVQKQYDMMELFRGTMLRHSFTAFIKGMDDTNSPNFNSQNFFSYVPIRIPETRIIEERLPPGAAAVLINQAHTDRDIFLPINSDEKQVLDAIDGSRSIKQVIDQVKSIHPANRLLEKKQVHNFFNHLWNYDQVVFDTSAVV